MRIRPIFAVAGVCIAALYVVAFVVGMRVKDLSSFPGLAPQEPKRAWAPPRLSSVPDGARGDSIRRGALLFNETPLYAGTFARARLSCSSCHAAGGIQPYASPLVGVPATFPMYNARAGRVISLKDRIQECFVRSENGRPIDDNGDSMRALVDYIDWLSTPEPKREAFIGRGLISMPDLKPDSARGGAIYAVQCAGCHGPHGEGHPFIFPPLWGEDSFNEGAGLYGLRKLAAFIQHNMPQNRMGILTQQEAVDVAGFIRAQPRPALDPAFKGL